VRHHAGLEPYRVQAHRIKRGARPLHGFFGTGTAAEPVANAQAKVFEPGVTAPVGERLVVNFANKGRIGVFFRRLGLHRVLMCKNDNKGEQAKAADAGE